MASQPVSRRDLESILGQTAHMWEQMRGQRLFLTGGTGFFGCWLLESFLYANRALSLGASVVALTRSPARFREKAPHLVDVGRVCLTRSETLEQGTGNSRPNEQKLLVGETRFDKNQGVRIGESVPRGTYSLC